MADDRNQNLNQDTERKGSQDPESRNEATEQRTGSNLQNQERGDTSGRGESSRETGLGEESETSSEQGAEQQDV
jgi:hypothetical protein